MSIDSSPAEAAQHIREREQLRLLSIGYYVFAGVTAVFSLIPLVHIALGVAFLVIPGFGAPPHGAAGGPPPALFGILFIAIGSSIILLGETLAALNFFAGRWIAQRRRRTFALIVGCVDCLNVPFGTALGVASLIVLSRPSVRTEFDQAASAAGPEPDPRWPSAA